MKYPLPVYVATLGPLGWVGIAPGTVGALAAVIVWWFGMSLMPTVWYWLITATLVGISVWSSSIAEDHLGKDPKMVNIDEFATQFIPLFFCFRSVLLVLICIVVSRIFDITKPFPISWLERNIPSGWGITIDDVAASVYASIVIIIVKNLGMS